MNFIKTFFILSLTMLSFSVFASTKTCVSDIQGQQVVFSLKTNLPFNISVNADGEVSTENNQKLVNFNQDKQNFIYVMNTPNGMVFSYRLDLKRNKVILEMIEGIYSVNEIDLSKNNDMAFQFGVFEMLSSDMICK